MEEYVTAIMCLAQQFGDINARIDDEFISVVMLSGLFSGYDPMVMVLESSGLHITSDLVKSKLLQEDVKRKQTENSRCNSYALYADSKHRNFCSTFKNKRKYIIKCFNCNKIGHKKNECRIKK